MSEGHAVKRIEQMYAFVVENEDNDHEGIPAMDSGIGPVPLVGADMAMVEKLRPKVKLMAAAMNKPVKLVRFEVRTELEVIEP